MKNFFNAVVLTLIASVTAQAASVTAFLDETAAGVWQLSAQVTPMSGDTLGVAGYSARVLDTDLTQVGFAQNPSATASFFDGMAVTQRGFSDPISGIVGGDAFFSAGATQATTDGSREVFDVGIQPVELVGLTTLSLGVPAVLGTFNTPAGLMASNFSNFEIQLFPSDYTNLNESPTLNVTDRDDLQVVINPLVVGGGAILVGDPAAPGPIDVTAAFTGNGTLADAIGLSNSEGPFGDLGAIGLDIQNDAEGLFSAALGGSGESVDLSINQALAILGPIRDVTATLLITSANGGDLTYDLVARVPEPATLGLVGLAMVGIAGLRRRS